MDMVEEIVRAVLMVVGLGVVLLVVAALFMVIFKIATGIDEQIQE